MWGKRGCMWQQIEDSSKKFRHPFTRKMVESFNRRTKDRTTKKYNYHTVDDLTKHLSYSPVDKSLNESLGPWNAKHRF